MKKISNYEILEKVGETNSSIVYRAQGSETKETVIIKLLKTWGYPDPAEITRLKQEYKMINRIETSGIVACYDTVVDHNGIALVLEDFHGISLKEILAEQKFDLGNFLHFATTIAGILGEIHNQNVVHKDIKPQNILINRDNGTVKLTDFGIATEITHINDDIYDNDVIQGTLYYISPEQTGRMNRGVDYRTDFYSLGITFYEILTGVVPFDYEDPVEIIHSHIARTPIAPEDLDPSIPAAVSRIISKLLEKNAEDRYQSCLGLKSDLEKCLHDYETKGEIVDFALGQNDISQKFIIPQTIVGREQEIDILMQAFQVARAGSCQIVLVTGKPGIGKSTLINEIHKPIVASKGYYFSGKFEQFRREVPYNAIIQAFTSLVKQLLSEAEDMIENWREKILEALGLNGKVMTEVVPDLEMIIGPQPDIPNLPPEESQNRFKLVFKNFLRVFAQREHPLVLFLDDLQWADPASLDLLESTLTESPPAYFMFIGSFRDNEIDSTHPLSIALEKIEKKARNINKMEIGPLSSDKINTLLSNFLHSDPNKTYPLAETIYNETYEKPFFINQFLKTLYEQGMIAMDPDTGWEWDLEDIKQMEVTDNVVLLLEEKINNLPKQTIDVLKVCSCIGNKFELEDLSSLLDISMENVLQNLNTAIDEGLVSQKNNIYCFHHDRIQEAAYSLLEEDDRIYLHYRIGQYFREKYKHQLADKIFFIVNHLNKSKTLINDPRERLGLAELNLQAGDRAKHSNAFESASQYYNTALSLLPENSWTEHYSTMFHLYSELGMCEYLKLNFEQAESFFNTALENAGSNFDQASLYNHMAEIIANQGKHQEAVRLYMKGLEKNHVRFNSNPGQLAIIFHLFSSRLKMLGKEPAELTNLPALNDRETQLTLKLLMNCINSAFFSDKNKFAYFILKAFQINLTYGNCFISPFVFFTYGAIYVTGLKKYKTGIEFADIALQINKEYFDPTVKTRLYCLYGVSMSIWKEHLYNSLDYLDQALKLAFQNGETRYAVYTQQSIVFTMLALGSALNELEDFSNKYFDFIMQSRDKGAISYNLTVRQLINALKDKTRGRTSLDDEEFDEAGHVEKMLAEDIPIVNHRHYLHKAMLCYLFNELEAALENIQISDRYLESSGGTICEPEHYFYQSLIITSLVRKEPSTYKNKLSKVRKNLKLLKKWAGLCPSNFRHKDYLIRAELADLEQDSKMAMDCYYKAIADAKENDFLLNNALANELFARFFARGGMFDLAEIYFSRAQFVYNHFGAIAKVGQLQELYPDYLTSAYQEPIFDPNKSNPHSLSGTSSSVPEIYSFDALSVTRAAQIISREIELDKLLEKSMKTILENAGAQRGVLVTQEEKSNKLYIEAEGEIDRPITLHQFLLLEDFDQVPHNIINYIFKTNEDVIINDLAREDNFANDPYLSKNRVGSLLCMPIRYKGYTTGVFYLENRLSSNVFTPERLQVLRMLISQVAISLDNAQLYKKAITDDLTELVTHNHFKFMLEKEVERSQRYKRQFSLIMFDIDNFKQINDIYGHLAGDEILLNLSSLAREEFRSADLIARYGGEEFTIILTETDYQGAYSAAERFRELIDGYTSWNVDFDPHITVSIGMSSFPQHGTSARAIIDSADQALYASKRAGRNKTTIYKKTSGESLLNVNFSGED